MPRCSYTYVRESDALKAWNRRAKGMTFLRQRDELAEALREMRYGHTDKAERMADAALKYMSRTPKSGTATLRPELARRLPRRSQHRLVRGGPI